MDEWTRERYGPLTEADLWHELHPGVPMPRELAEADARRRRRQARLEEIGLLRGYERGVREAA